MLPGGYVNIKMTRIQCLYENAMDATILSSPVVLLHLIWVIAVAAYFLTGSRLFTEVPAGHPAIKTQVILRSRALAAKEITAKILESVRAFCGDHLRSDDITRMVIRVV